MTGPLHDVKDTEDDTDCVVYVLNFHPRNTADKEGKINNAINFADAELEEHHVLLGVFLGQCVVSHLLPPKRNSNTLYLVARIPTPRTPNTHNTLSDNAGRLPVRTRDPLNRADIEPDYYKPFVSPELVNKRNAEAHKHNSPLLRGDLNVTYERTQDKGFLELGRARSATKFESWLGLRIIIEGPALNDPGPSNTSRSCGSMNTSLPMGRISRCSFGAGACGSCARSGPMRTALNRGETTWCVFVSRPTPLGVRACSQRPDAPLLDTGPGGGGGLHSAIVGCWRHESPGSIQWNRNPLPARGCDKEQSKGSRLRRRLWESSSGRWSGGPTQWGKSSVFVLLSGPCTTFKNCPVLAFHGARWRSALQAPSTMRSQTTPA